MRHSIDIWQDRHPLWNLMNEFEEAFNQRVAPRSAAQEARFQPAVDVEESENYYLLSFDLPGVKKEDVQIDLTDRQLTVSGQREKKVDKTTGGLRQYERVYGKFHRTFQLPQLVDTNQIEANYEDGVLQILIPKAEAAKAKTIQIQSGKPGFFERLLKTSEVTDKGSKH